MNPDTFWGMVLVECRDSRFKLKADNIPDLQTLLDFAAGKPVITDVVEMMTKYGAPDSAITALLQACTTAS